MGGFEAAGRTWLGELPCAPDRLWADFFLPVHAPEDNGGSPPGCANKCDAGLEAGTKPTGSLLACAVRSEMLTSS